MKAGLRKRERLKKEYRHSQCMASDDRSIMILPDGHLGKCEHFPDKDFVGSIYEGITKPEFIQYWKEKKELSKLCADCPLVPFCRILLKHCPSNQNDCTAILREQNIQEIKKKMVYTY